MMIYLRKKLLDHTTAVRQDIRLVIEQTRGTLPAVQVYAPPFRAHTGVDVNLSHSNQIAITSKRIARCDRS